LISLGFESTTQKLGAGTPTTQISKNCSVRFLRQTELNQYLLVIWPIQHLFIHLPFPL